VKRKPLSNFKSTKPFSLIHFSVTSSSFRPLSLYKLLERETTINNQNQNHFQISTSMANNQNQKQLIYAFVSRGTVILAEFTEFSGNFNSIAFQCLQKLPSTNNKFTYNCDNHTFNYLIDNGYSKFNFPFDLTLFFTHRVRFYVQLILSLVVLLHKLLNPSFS